MKSVPPLFFLGLLLMATRLEGALTLAGIFTDQAVLQREAAVPVWGWADPGAEIVLEFAGQKVTTLTGSDGKWITKLAAMAASAEPRVLKITAGDQSLTRSEVLVGDVWLCSGQSNMDASMSTPSPVLREAITKAGNPHLRLFATLNQFPDAPVQDTTGRWEPATPETVKRWTAVGYLFGLRIQRELGVPVGIVCSARGGTQIETWLPTAMLAANPANQFFLQKHAEAVQRLPETMADYQKASEEFRRQFPDAKAIASENQSRRERGEQRIRQPREPAGRPGSATNPAACYNGKIAPLLPYALKGVLWYQGEGNVFGFSGYPSQMADLIRAWREGFQIPSLPFIATELAPLGPPSKRPEDAARARFGEALAKVEKNDPLAWVVTIVDGGDPEDIHPAQKEIPGERFAAMALAKVYGRNLVAHGPRLESWKAEAGKAVLKFSSVGGGLVARSLQLGGHSLSGDKIEGFELAGADRKLVRAEARVVGNDTLVIESPEVPQPVAVRYAWGAFPLCNLFNQEGFPAYPFRTDSWPWKTPADVPPAKNIERAAIPGTPAPRLAPAP